MSEDAQGDTLEACAFLRMMSGELVGWMPGCRDGGWWAGSSAGTGIDAGYYCW